MISPPWPGSRIPHFAGLPSKVAERNRYRAFDANVVGSVHMAQTLLRNGFPQDQTHVVPHFSRFESDATSPIEPIKQFDLPGRDRPFKLLFSGQAVTGKGLEVLIKALSGLEGNWRLTVLAEGPCLAPARAMAEAAGLSSRIGFLGWAPQSATREYYLAADLLVIPSIWDDPVPLVGIEAMSFGTALVGFAVGGIPDYLLDDETGLLVRSVTAEALRAALARAMSEPERLRAWGEAARKLVARSHTRTVHIKAIHRIYAQENTHADQASCGPCEALRACVS